MSEREYWEEYDAIKTRKESEVKKSSKDNRRDVNW